MLFLAECIPISELGCEKIALYSFIYIAHKTLMMNDVLTKESDLFLVLS